MIKIIVVKIIEYNKIYEILHLVIVYIVFIILAYLYGIRLLKKIYIILHYYYELHIHI